MKISIKPFECHNTQDLESQMLILNDFKKKYKNKCYINQKVIHHNHILKDSIILLITSVIIVT